VRTGSQRNSIRLMHSLKANQPAAWPTAPLGDIAEVKLGKMLDKSKHLAGRKLPYLRNINVRWGSVDTTDLLEMNFKDDELARFGLKHGDVLVCEGGEPGRAAVWNNAIPNMKYQKAIHRIRFKQPYEQRLLVYLLELLAKTGRLERRFTGSTIKHFTREAIVQLPIPVPPLDEHSASLRRLRSTSRDWTRVWRRWSGCRPP
jgi:type I restriction enzyme, S subunit